MQISLFFFFFLNAIQQIHHDSVSQHKNSDFSVEDTQPARVKNFKQQSVT